MKINLFILSTFSILLISCTNTHTDEHKKAKFKVSQAIQTDTLINIEYVCQIHSYQHIELRALEKGYLQNIFVDEGQRVKKGDLLFQIQPTIYEAEALKAQSEVEFAELEYQNIKALSENDIVSKSELAMVKAKLAKSKAELTLAQTHLNFTQIRAPFDGIVGKFEDVRLGSLLDEGELLTTLSDNSKMWVYFNVPESEYLDYATQEKISKKNVQLKLANNSIFSEIGYVETIESDFNNATGNIAFRASFKNPNGLLRHGQTGSIIWPKELSDILIIPQRSTYEILEKKYVYLVSNDGEVRSHEVKIAGEMDHLYFIKNGLQKSDKFLIEGLRKVESGDVIEFDLIAPEKVLKGLNLHAE